jgi:hypothetical protein
LQPLVLKKEGDQNVKKLIFSEPVCTKIACTHHDPAYPNNCAITTSVEGCCMADIHYPNYLQRAFAWIGKRRTKGNRFPNGEQE